ncbi:uncharacterized protein LOC122511164 isoform X2 [Leptopilina heterotoma]|uniref:uncharacterized protein LOC122511164 isoform X2 n=1 Tax=Leptopilina heterotoma TaxID=63436 RepID=UPI001CA8DBFE|nr:uncharacterized protein LOC122511164 isoform X2 [Leptopilina heterotoma]
MLNKPILLNFRVDFEFFQRKKKKKKKQRDSVGSKIGYNVCRRIEYFSYFTRNFLRKRTTHGLQEKEALLEAQTSIHIVLDICLTNKTYTQVDISFPKLRDVIMHSVRALG